jgi:uncharacterized protein YcfJ
MKNVEETKPKKGFFKRLRAKTPDHNKKVGKFFTAIGLVAGTILSAGVITAPLGVTILTVVTAVSGGIAVFNGQKVDESEK